MHKALLTQLIGTSPRMRGKQPHVAQMVGAVGNIPAYAGKTKGAIGTESMRSEHPRVCGENALRKAARGE